MSLLATIRRDALFYEMALTRQWSYVHNGRISHNWTWPDRSLTQRRLSPQDVVIVLGEAMGLVANVLQQPQCVGMPA